MRHSNIFYGCLAAFAMFAFGFGTLNLFWHFGTYPDGLPGLYDYRAATWGDGLFLSLGAGAFVAYLSGAKRLDGRVPKIAPILCAIAGLVSGVLM